MNTSKDIWIACGGSGGHFMPGLVCGRQLTEKGFEVKYWGEGKKIEVSLCQSHQVKMHRPIGGGGRLKRAVILSFKLFFSALKKKPSLCIMCGGFTSYFMAKIARLFSIPYVILEQNTIPGKVNQSISKHSKVNFMTFPGSEKFMQSECILSGNPVRCVDVEKQKEIDVLIIGGSQGALYLNEKLATLIEGSLKIVLICGPGHLEVSKIAWQQTNHQIEILEESSDIPSLANKSKWVFTRAGATSLSELAGIGAAVIAIPYTEAAENHQYLNAVYLEENNAAVMLQESEFELKKEQINLLLSQDNQYLKYGENLKNTPIADINGEKTISYLIEKVL